MCGLAMPTAVYARPLSLQEALSLAVVHHPDVVESGLLRDQASAAVQSARAQFDPAFTASAGAQIAQTQGFIAGFPASTESEGWDTSLGVSGQAATGTSWSVSTGLERDVTNTLASFGGAPQEQEQSTWATSVEVAVTQDVLAFLRSSQQRNQVVEARERLDQAELAVLRSTQRAVTDVAESWWAWWAAEATATVAVQSRAQAEALYERTEARFAEGQIARVEVDRVEADRLAAERDELEARADVRAAADALLVAIGLDPGLAIEVVGPERISPLDPEGRIELDDTLTAALDANLELGAARLDVQAAERRLSDAREVSLPTLDLTGRAGVSTLTNTAGESFEALTTEDSNPFAAVSLGLTVPLGGRAALAARTEAGAALDIEQLQLDALRREVVAAVRTALDSLVTARRGVDLATRRVAVARATEEAEAARADEGTRRLDQLLDARTTRQAAEAELVAARVQQARAELDLARLEGRLLAEVLNVE